MPPHVLPTDRATMAVYPRLTITHSRFGFLVGLKYVRRVFDSRRFAFDYKGTET